MPVLPELFDEPDTWGLPPLAANEDSSARLTVEHDAPLCTSDDGSFCVVRTTTPILNAHGVGAHPELGYEYAVWDLSAENAQGAVSGATWDTEWQVPAGTLRQGQSYVAAVSPARTPGEDPPPENDDTTVQFFHVDLAGVGVQEMYEDSGFAVAPYTGELTVSGNITVSDVSLRSDVSWSSLERSQEQVGPLTDPLPEGWSIDVAAPIEWHLIEVFPASGALQMSNVRGGRQRFYDKGDGTYNLVLEQDGEAATSAAKMTRDETYGGWRYLDEFGNEYVFDFRGELRSYTPAFASGFGAVAYEVTWVAPGRLGSVTDPVSGRSVEYHYAGVSPVCTSAPPGFDRAALLDLCAVAVHDDPGDSAATHTTTLGWTGNRLAAFLRPDGARTDVRYDHSGNVVGLRHPVHAVAAAMEAIDPQSTDLETTFAYDESGRVEQVTYPVREHGQARAVVEFTYEPGASHIETTSVETTAPMWISRIFDPESWALQRTEMSDGSDIQMLFDERGVPTGNVVNGTLQSYFEVVDSPVVEHVTWGPAPTHMFDPDTGTPLDEYRDRMPRSIERFDSTTDATGWLVTWWDSVERDRAAAALTLEQHSSISSESGDLTEAWSAEFIGFVPAIVGAEYSVEVEGAELQTFLVEGIEGDPTVTVDRNAGSKLIVEAVVAGSSPPSTESPLSLVVSAYDDGVVHIFDVNETTAGLNLPTETTRREFLSTDGPPSEIRLVHQYSDPLIGLVGESTRYIDDVEDRSLSSTYEGLTPEFDELHRQLSHTEGSGFEVAHQYWGPTERATPPGYASAVLQGGLERAAVDPHPTDPQLDGRTISTWWTAHGQSAALHDDSTDTTMIFEYDERLRQTRVSTSAGFQPGGNGALSAARTLEFEYLVTADGYPAILTTSTVDNETLTSLAIENFGGAELLVTDYAGAQTYTTYADNAVTKVTYLATSSGVVEVSSTTEVDPRTLQVVAERATTLTGEELFADLTFDPDEPLKLQRVDYSNGLSVEYEYDDFGHQVGRTWTDDQGTQWSDHVTLTTSGRVSDRRQDANDVSTTYGYDFHRDGTAKEMVMTSGNDTITWSLGFDPLPANLAGSNPEAVLDFTPSTISTVWQDGSSDAVTIGYDRSNAPQTVTRDGQAIELVIDRTNIVTYDQTKLVFDQTHAPISILSGGGGRLFEYDAAGVMTQTTLVADGRETVIVPAAGGLTLVDSEVAGQTVGFAGGLVVEIDARGNRVRIGDYFDNTWAELAPGATLLDTAEPLRFLPYGQPVRSEEAARTGDAPTHSAEEPIDLAVGPHHGWLGLTGLEEPNQMTFTGARVMINEIGSFASIDPIRAGSTDYSYADGNPFDWHDRSGNQPTEHQMQVLFSTLGIALFAVSLAVPASGIIKIALWHVIETALEVGLLLIMVEAGYIDHEQILALIVMVSVLNVASLLAKFYDFAPLRARLKGNVKIKAARQANVGNTISAGARLDYPQWDAVMAFGARKPSAPRTAATPGSSTPRADGQSTPLPDNSKAPYRGEPLSSVVEGRVWTNEASPGVHRGLKPPWTPNSALARKPTSRRHSKNAWLPAVRSKNAEQWSLDFYRESSVSRTWLNRSGAEPTTRSQAVANRSGGSVATVLLPGGGLGHRVLAYFDGQWQWVIRMVDD
ncbi:MAG: hypothetical protein AAGF73_04570 [Actinomycetota bacterium]